MRFDNASWADADLSYAATRRDLLQAAVLAAAGGAAGTFAPALQPLAPPAHAAAPALQPMTASQSKALAAVTQKLVTKTKAPLLLRLLFHDAFTYRADRGDGGPNSSVQFELDRPENQGLKRGWSTIQEVSRFHQRHEFRLVSRAALSPNCALVHGCNKACPHCCKSTQAQGTQQCARLGMAHNEPAQARTAPPRCIQCSYCHAQKTHACMHARPLPPQSSTQECQRAGATAACRHRCRRALGRRPHPRPCSRCGALDRRPSHPSVYWTERRCRRRSSRATAS